MIIRIRYMSGAVACLDLDEGNRIVRFEDFATTDGRVVDASGAMRGLIVSPRLDVKRFRNGEPGYLGKPEHTLLVHDAQGYDDWIAATVLEIYVDDLRIYPL